MNAGQEDWQDSVDLLGEQLVGPLVLVQTGQKIDSFSLPPCFQVSFEERVSLPAAFLIPNQCLLQHLLFICYRITCLISPCSRVPNGSRP